MGKRYILLVEDNPGDIELTRRALTKAEVLNDLVVAQDGVEALDHLFGKGKHTAEDLPGIPELILLDLKLPRIDGLEVLKRVRANPLTKLLPVVVLTSSCEEKDLIRSYELGCNSYIQKPVDFNQFVETVRQLGLYWLLLNQSPPSPRRGQKGEIRD